MPRRQITFRTGEYYHVYNRGHNRQIIFNDRKDSAFFLRRLRESVTNVSQVVAYCLMPNHFHLLLRLTSDDISSEMHRLCVSYAKAWNRRRGNVGSVFQGPFQAIHVDEEIYLLHLTRYIHRNPIEAGLVQAAGQWEFSSCPEYFGERRGSLPHTAEILREFGGQEQYRTFVEGADTYPQGIERYLIDEE